MALISQYMTQAPMVLRDNCAKWCRTNSDKLKELALEVTTMALISQYYSTQAGSYAMLSRRLLPTSWSEEVKLKPFVTIKMVGRLNSRTASWKRHFFASRSMLGRPLILQRDVKRLKVSALLEEGSCSQNDEAAGSSKTNESIVSRNNFIYNLSDVTHELAEETMIGSPTKNYNNSGDDEETIAEYPDDIYELFKKLVMMLRNEAPPNQSTRGIFGDAPTQGNVSEIQNQIGSQEQEEVKILKAIWHYSKEFFEWVTFFLWCFSLVVIRYYSANVPSKTIVPLWYFRTIMIWGLMVESLDVEWLSTICWRTIRLLKRLGFI